MIEIGGLKLKNNIFLAPIAGYSDSPFRRIAIKQGAGLVVTELISSEGIIRNNKKTTDLLKFNEKERPIAIQIFGSSPEVMGNTAEIVQEFAPDLIDINMGCPAQKVCKKSAGAALLLDIDRLKAIAESVVKRVKIPVTAKIRIGWDDSNKNYMDVVKALEQSGITAIFVHGRTRAQKYKGTVDWDIIKEIRDNASVPIIGNGDILSHKEAEEKINLTGCPAVMIGRAAIGNPWIFTGKEPSARNVIDLIKVHLDLMIEYYGERGLILMRKHMVKYIHGIRDASKLRRRLVTSDNRSEVIEILESLI